MHYSVAVLVPSEFETLDAARGYVEHALEPFYEGLEIELVTEKGQAGEEDYQYWINPQGKWDWYVIGGRWRGELMVDVDAVLGQDYDMTPPSAFDKFDLTDYEHRADVARKRVIDFQGMVTLGRIKAEEAWDKATEAYAGLTAEEKEQFNPYWTFGLSKNDFDSLTREEFLTKQKFGFSTWAFIDLDGTWHEKETFVYDETKPPADWSQKNPDYYDDLRKAIAKLPDDAWVAVVDIHS